MKATSKKPKSPESRHASDGVKITIVDDSRANGRPLKTVTYGSVTVTGPAPTEEEIQANVKAGQEALARGLKALLKPGVKLDLPEHIPRYSAAPDRPGYLVRELRGKKTIGRFVDGRFRVSKS